MACDSYLAFLHHTASELTRNYAAEQQEQLTVWIKFELCQPLKFVEKQLKDAKM